ncbi:MAG: radical SAM protein [Lawsonibacter sp.]|jgi:pyruvate-formate lyase-activating enzyme|nr:radical SAM protein [Lawsonibacter sp.]
MNHDVKNLNRIEFVVTYACTGRCKHCSEGDHSGSGPYLGPETAARVVRDAAGRFPIASVMTFGGEPLLHPETVCAVHAAAAELGVPKRQLITNGFFSRNGEAIERTAQELARSGVNDILLSVDAFHQEAIPLEPVKAFAEAAVRAGVSLRTHPAWVAGRQHENSFNRQTAEIVSEFEKMGILQSDGNIIIPQGNALKYLSEYYDLEQEYADPYEEDPEDIRTVCVDPDGGVLGGNVCQESILEILERYTPHNSPY